MEINWKEEYQVFAARKEAAAKSDAVPGFLPIADNAYRFNPPLLPVGAPEAEALLGGPFYASPIPDSGRPGVSVVFVQSKPAPGKIYGNTGAKNPGDLGGGKTDLHAVYEGLSRVAADGVLAGANTIRPDEDNPISRVFFTLWRKEMINLRAALGQRRHPNQIIATASGNLEMDKILLFNLPPDVDVCVYILTTREGALRLDRQAQSRPVTVIVSGEKTLDLTSGLETLRRFHDIRTVSAVGGRQTATALIKAGLVRDLYLTTAAKEGGERDTPFWLGPAGDLRKKLALRMAGQGEEKGVVFEHFLLS